MPIYEYKCRVCGHGFERFALRSSITSSVCPACHSEDVERLLSLFAVNSPTTRAAALNSGRKQAARIERDKAHADIEYEKDHRH
jgi:putative FmdB family regulatory protein